MDAANTLSADNPPRALSFRYRNWRGDTALRTVGHRSASFLYGTTPYHPRPQWFLRALDAEKGAMRDYAIEDILGFGPSFQERVWPWLTECFGPEIAGDREERNHRFLEEALELVQSLGCTRHEAHQLVDYVFGRAPGEPGQEVGGVEVTLASLCLANGLDKHAEAERELARILAPEIMAKIRAKQAAKPKHSPFPALPSFQPGQVLRVPLLEHVPGETRELLGARLALSAMRERCSTGLGGVAAVDELLEGIEVRLVVGEDAIEDFRDELRVLLSGEYAEGEGAGEPAFEQKVDEVLVAAISALAGHTVTIPQTLEAEIAGFLAERDLSVERHEATRDEQAESAREIVGMIRKAMPWAEDLHTDDAAVDLFARAMREKLAKKRAKGFGGWDADTCNAQDLSRMLRRHVDKGDPVDVANLAMFLHQRGERIEPIAQEGERA